MENSHLLDKHFSAMKLYESAVIMRDTPIFAEIVDHYAVSVCNSARQSVLGAECYIATTETHRNFGHAKNVTKHWAEEVYNSGKLPFLNTTVNNYATIKIANNLGFSLVGRVLRVSPRNCGEFITTFT
jgi:predicted GNAT family acetyltransferase